SKDCKPHASQRCPWHRTILLCQECPHFSTGIPKMSEVLATMDLRTNSRIGKKSHRHSLLSNQLQVALGDGAISKENVRANAVKCLAKIAGCLIDVPFLQGQHAANQV